ncbi:undecaprenyl-diphosphatase UppP [Candidatus Parcubacteria bacterium]|nr:undecaprenyl-diphosphatase UppP [Candidatus Parcubacteria bacterium]
MDYIVAIIFGITQGITEFIPVSSSGHLVILHDLFTLPIKNDLVFDVVLHLATILAVLIYFWRDIVLIIKNLLARKDKIAWYIIIATIPAAIIGFLGEDIITAHFRSTYVVVIMLIIVGVLFFASEKIGKQIKDYKELTWKTALLIGLFQAIALIPGTSRSGITIVAGLLMGLKRQQAVKFSFLLSLPIILGANLFKLPDLLASGLIAGEYIVLFIAFLTAFFSGLVAIKYFLRFSARYSLHAFAYYRFALALVLAGYLWWLM